MSIKKIDYKAVLADLKAQKDRIDKAIASIQAIIGIQGGEGDLSITGTNGSEEVGSIIIRPDTFFNMSTVDGAKKYLEMRNDPQTAKQIAEVLKRGGMKTLAKNFVNNVNAILKRDEKTVGTFIRVDKRWGLSKWYSGKRKGKESVE